MSEFTEELSKWFEEFQKIPPDSHLLCPRVSKEDDEDYRTLDDPRALITAEEKKRRIQKGDEHIEITYWNSLIFAFDKSDAGQWLVEFSSRLERCLQNCTDCLLNWHMRRRKHLQQFSERWDEDAVMQIEDMFDRLDIRRIDNVLKWAKEQIETKEAENGVFKKSQLGERLVEVHLAVYDALCCMAYISEPDQRTTFQYVFMRLQGKSHLKLSTKVPLPAMSFFLYDQKNEDRRSWAFENWKSIDTSSMSEEYFDWAVSKALINGIGGIAQRDFAHPSTETFLAIETFWQATVEVLRAMPGPLIFSRLQSLEVKPGSPSFCDLLLRHVQFCQSEGVLVVCIRVIVILLNKSPKSIWDFLGEAKPNVLADIIFGSPMYKVLLRQSLDDCWSDHNTSVTPVPFPTSWIKPWLQSVSRDRRYDACEVLAHTLFESFAKDPSIGEAGQATCIRAGFDALVATMTSYLDPDVKVGSGTTHLYANAAVNLAMKYSGLIARNMAAAGTRDEGWKTFDVGGAAKDVISNAMMLDMKLFSEEYQVINENQKSQHAVTRDSKAFWNMVVGLYDSSKDQINFSREILRCLSPLVAVEQIRPLKTKKLEESSRQFNEALNETEDVLARVLGRISELDVTGLQSVFSDRAAFQALIGLSIHGETDLAEAAAEVLKNWTGELTRSGAMEQMSQLHTEQTLASVIWCLERVFKPPFLWGPIRPLLNMSRDVLRGLADPSSGVLRTTTMDPKLVALVLRWWNEQWRFVSASCLKIERWSALIQNAVMTEFCREIMELAEAIIAEDGLFTSATMLGRSEKTMMIKILEPAKENFRGMENMIRLKDLWLVDVTVRVLCKILKRLRENGLEINAASRKLITDACIPTSTPGKYLRSTNLSDGQRAELLQALGQNDDEVQIIQLGKSTLNRSSSSADVANGQLKKQSKLDAWSKSATSTGESTSKTAGQNRSNRQDVMELSKSIDNPLLKQIEARQAKARSKVKTLNSKSISASISSIKESRQREKAEKAKRDQEAILQAKRLRGETIPGESGSLLGPGIIGKDHSKSDIMVNSSDEESSDEESDSDNQLAALSTGDQKRMSDAEKLRRMAMRDQLRGPVKKTRQQRSVKEMRARLIPPMDRLHNAILGWDIFHKGDNPPQGPAAAEVATKYTDPRSYQDTFFPLLISEAWLSFVTSKDEITAQPFGMKIMSRATVDSFLEVTFTMPKAPNRERVVSEGDILLVSEDERPLSSPSSKHCLARVHRISYKKDVLEISYRVSGRANQLTPMLTPGNNIYGIRITNMTTIEREYAALESLQYYDLMDEILKAEPSPILRYGDEKINNWMQNWSLNRGQAMAVLGAQDNDGFTLIQGPPGTGKTKTIVAMVGALLSEQLANQSMAKGTPIGAPLRPAGALPSGAQGQNRPKKLLVCAPSNAAVDELVLRLKAGITAVNGRGHQINVVRLGRSDAINAAVKDVTLEELVRAKLEGDDTKEKARADRDKLHSEAARVKEELSQLRPQLEAARGAENDSYESLSRQFDKLKREQMQLGKQIDANKDSGNSVAREMEMRRRQVQQTILNEAHVLCATLSGSGHEMFRNLDVEFETVIIDEAAQCVELSALIPLKYGCCKCILVGDPKQLPPTVLSQSAARFGYDQSLFVRMQQNHPKSVHLLDMQYRMHPEISMFPSREFYEGQLLDGQDMARLRQQPWHRTSLLGPYRFFDVQGVQQKGARGQSLVNVRELEVAMQIYERFRKDFREVDLSRKIGIITPYKAQLFELRNRFRSRFGESITDMIEFNTTDAFQGRECEIIIFSCVRASSTGGIGFMTDIRRMNVGLTRAKSSLWILGDSRALVQGQFWRKLIDDAKARDRYTQGDVLGLFKKPLAQGTLPDPGQYRSPSGDVAMEDAPGLSVDSIEANSGHPEQVSKLEHSPSSGPRTQIMPTIQTSSSAPRDSGTKKRPPDGPSAGQPQVKRVANDRPRSGLAGKFGQKPARPPKLASDPSAMSVLGLVPPDRPRNAPHKDLKDLNATPNLGATPKALHAAAAIPQRPPKTDGNKAPPTGPRKKSKPSMFVPRKK